MARDSDSTSVKRCTRPCRMGHSAKALRLPLETEHTLCGNQSSRFVAREVTGGPGDVARSAKGPPGL